MLGLKKRCEADEPEQLTPEQVMRRADLLKYIDNLRQWDESQDARMAAVAFDARASEHRKLLTNLERQFATITLSTERRTDAADLDAAQAEEQRAANAARAALRAYETAKANRERIARELSDSAAAGATLQLHSLIGSMHNPDPGPEFFRLAMADAFKARGLRITPAMHVYNAKGKRLA